MLKVTTLAPTSPIALSSQWALDAASCPVIRCAFDFLIPPFAVFVGVDSSVLVKGRDKLGIVAGISLAVMCAPIIPGAYSSQGLFGFENRTQW